MARFGKKNHVSLSVLDTSVIMMGSPKIGKSSICKEIAEKLCGEGYLFLEMYRETGADLIEGIIYENVETWEKFKEIVEDIEDNKTTDYKDLKLVIIDTWDNGLCLAEQESIRLWNKANPDKKTDSIQAAWSGFMRGQDKAADLMDDMVYRLRAVGITVWIIMHVKTSNITDPVSGETFQQLSSDVTQRYFSRLKRNTDLIAVAYADRKIIKEKTGKKNPVTHKDELKGVLKSESRKIKFRDSSYVIDAGGRLAHIVEEIPFSADAFIEAVTNALEEEVKSKGGNLEERKKEDEARLAKRQQEIAEAESEHKKKKELDTIIYKIKDFVAVCKEKKDGESVKGLIAKAKELGYEVPYDVSTVEDAKALLGYIESLS